jgi:hypothetical protein
MKKRNSRTKFNPSDPSTWPPLLNISQVSKILNLSIWTLRQWDNKGKLVALRFGNRRDRRYKKEDILKIKEGGI